MKLGVNVDHVATLRQARRIVDYPDPLAAALLAEKAGADSIVIHLREDRRHIQDKDAFSIKQRLKKGLNLEMSIDRKIVAQALKLKPRKATIVPERRQEITTEGGFDLIGNEPRIRDILKAFGRAKIELSVFINPTLAQITKAKALKIRAVELHTGKYADAENKKERDTQFRRIYEAARFAKNLGFFVAAGHGLNYTNVRRIAGIEHIDELNIGHSIIAEAVFSGMSKAVKKMKKLIRR